MKVKRVWLVCERGQRGHHYRILGVYDNEKAADEDVANDPENRYTWEWEVEKEAVG